MTLRDALEGYDEFRTLIHLEWGFVRHLAAAARRVAEAPEWTICEVHKSLQFGADAGRPFCEYAYIKQYDGPPNACRMVRKLLVDPPEENR